MADSFPRLPSGRERRSLAKIARPDYAITLAIITLENRLLMD